MNYFPLGIKKMNRIHSFFGLSWRILAVGLAYFIGLVGGGIISVSLGTPAPSTSSSIVLWLLVTSLLLGLFLNPLAVRLSLAGWQHFLLWLSLIFFNMGSVAIEGKFFAPNLVPMSLSVLLVQQLLAAAAAAFMITLTCATPGNPISWLAGLQRRAWFDWLWRFAVSTASYLVFYFIFGALNYSLVTGPYYATHAGSLTTPPMLTIFIAELFRAPLIVLSILLFLLSARGTKRALMFEAGWLLFTIGGIVPLVLQIGSLPPLLLAASSVEIFFQNFLTGAVSARLLGIEKPGEAIFLPANSLNQDPQG